MSHDIVLEHVACALCGGRETRQRHHKFGLTVVQCRRCRLVYTNPRLPKDDLWTRYNDRYFWEEYLPALGIGRDGRVDLDAFAVHHGPLLYLISMYAPPPGRLLEVGAAAGLFLKSAERAGWHASGLEPMPTAAAFARDRLGVDVREDPVEHARFDDGAFDVVAMFETIEHVLDPMAVLRAVRRVLRAGGVLVLTTPNWEAFSRHALGRQWAVISPAEHLYYFSEATLTAMLSRAGFSKVHYHRDFAPRPIETMNAAYTNAPHSVRRWLYATLIDRFGYRVFRDVQRRGLADQLVCVAHA